MKLAEIDLKPFYYAAYQSDTMLTDADGNFTGERGPSYGTPTLMHGSMSMAAGRTEAKVFGTALEYDKVIHIEDTVCPFDENARIWIDADTSGDPNYKVARIGVADGFTAIAVKRVRS